MHFESHTRPERIHGPLYIWAPSLKRQKQEKTSRDLHASAQLNKIHITSLKCKISQVQKQLSPNFLYSKYMRCLEKQNINQKSG